MRCSVVFGVMSGLLVINISSSSPQWLKWNIRGEGNIQPCISALGQNGPPTSGSGLFFMKFKVWERWISITGGTGTAFPCVQWHFNHCFSHNQHRRLLPAMCHNLRVGGRRLPATLLTTPGMLQR